MLIVARRKGQRIRIGDNIEVMVVRIGPGVVRIGIAAPKDMSIFRPEITAKPVDDEAEPATDQFTATDWLKSR